MSSPGSVTVWLAQLKAGDTASAERLWEGYFRRLVGLARHKLQGMPRATADEEDVALSAFNSFCEGVKANRFPELSDRHGLWQPAANVNARCHVLARAPSCLSKAAPVDNAPPRMQ